MLFLLAAAIALVLSLNGLSNRFVRLGTRQVTVLNLPRGLEGFTILHISDLNAAKLGENQENLKEALGKEGYQAVVMSGDMVGKSGRAEPLLDVLDVIPDNVPVFFIAGDADPAPLLVRPEGETIKAGYVLRAEARGAIYLEAPYKLETEGQVVWFCPADTFLVDLPAARFSLMEQMNLLEGIENLDPAEKEARLQVTRHRLGMLEAAMAALLEMKPTDMVVAVSHHPPGSEQLGELAQRARIEETPLPGLFLAGQFNNGQTRLPGLGPVYIPEQMDGRGGFLPGDEGFTGLSITKGFPLHISPGLGISTYYPLPLRLFNRPSVTLLSLTSRMTR